MDVRTFSENFERLRREMATVVVGQSELTVGVLAGMMAQGHVLIEGAPGLGKTLVARTLAMTSGASFKRIQFTPDLMPSDITGSSVLDRQSGTFNFIPGPLFAELVLADEINRAPAKTQSALLEAMQDRQVTVDGTSRPLPQTFTVLATQNPIEMEGTYPLPEAQLDRFLLKIVVPRPDAETTQAILAATTGEARAMPESVMTAEALIEARGVCRGVLIATPLLARVTRMLARLDPDDPAAHPRAKERLAVGPGVRAGQAIVLAAKARALMAGRGHVAREDLDAVALPALRHRLIRNYEVGEFDPDALVREALSSLPEDAA